MAVVIINPNSTVSMTQAMVRVARASAPRIEFEGWTSSEGPPSIQGPEDGQRATPPLLNLIKRAADAGARGIIIGCFDDTGLVEASRLARCPVIGIGQAAYHFAALHHWRFSVVTTLSVSVPVLEANIGASGLDHLLARVRASDVPVLELERDPAEAGRQILAEASSAAMEDRVDAVILGCAGMVQVVDEVTRALDVAVIDPVACAARCFSWLAPTAEMAV